MSQRTPGSFRKDYRDCPVIAHSGATYVPGISERRSGTTTYAHSGIKNEFAQSSGTSLASTRTYDAFGATTASTGTWSGTFGYAGAFGYEEDQDSGLKLLGNRYYDASLGRFLSRDPIKDGSNWYSYCGGNPVSNADPSGLSPHLPDKRERAEFDAACGHLDLVGKSDLAKIARKMLKEDRIVIDDLVGCRGVTQAFPDGTNVIYLENELFQDMSGKAKRVRGELQLLQEWGLASVLAHEVTHIKQPYFTRRFNVPDDHHYEDDAYDTAIEVLKRALLTEVGDRFFEKEIDRMIEESKSAKSGEK